MNQVHMRILPYEEFVNRFVLPDDSETLNKFLWLQRTNIEQISVTIDQIPLHIWTLRALAKLNCQTALAAIMLKPEEMFSGVGLGRIGFHDLQTWFVQNVGIDPWPGVNPDVYFKFHARKKKEQQLPSTLSWWQAEPSSNIRKSS